MLAASHVRADRLKELVHGRAQVSVHVEKGPSYKEGEGAARSVKDVRSVQKRNQPEDVGFDLSQQRLSRMREKKEKQSCDSAHTHVNRGRDKNATLTTKTEAKVPNSEKGPDKKKGRENMNSTDGERVSPRTVKA